MGTRRRFSREFKIEAVKLACERGVTVSQAARDLDVHVNVLRGRVRAHREDPLRLVARRPQLERWQSVRAARRKRAELPLGVS